MQMTGTEDIIVPVQAATQLASRIPGAPAGRVCPVPGAVPDPVRPAPPRWPPTQDSSTRSNLASMVAAARCPLGAGAWLVQFPGAGHGFLWEHLEASLAVVDTFLSGPPAPRAPAGAGSGAASRGGAAQGEL